MKEKVKLCVAFAAHTLKSSHLCQGGGWTLGAGVEDVPYNYMRGGPVFTAVTSDFIREQKEYWVLVLTGNTGPYKVCSHSCDLSFCHLSELTVKPSVDGVTSR